ncbi:MAG: NAD(P)H-hydrate epimerase, partial [Pseudomonadota bacterium]|nr:NAD(P)H-hydrate epimerase [Pseudomonadota bacterium]
MSSTRYHNPMEGDFEHLYSSEGSRLVDREAINSLQLAEGELMERAGAAAYGVICRRWPGISTLNVVCGPGNNGGDGYIVARLAHEAGIKVRVCQVVSPKTDDAQRALEQLNLRGVTVEPANIETIGEAELVVDAVLGTGLSRRPSGVFKTAIQAINASGRPVLALDCPSGLDMDTGWTGGVAVQATVTVAFICLKGGLLTGRAPDLTGDIVVECLEVPAAVLTNVEPMACCISARIVQERLPARRRTMHKGEAGHLVVIGGDVSMAGAAQLAGTAALRTGAGLVTIATRRSNMDAIGRSQPELMCHPVEDQLSLETVLAGKTAVVVGPGLGQSQWGVEMLS